MQFSESQQRRLTLIPVATVHGSRGTAFTIHGLLENSVVFEDPRQNMRTQEFGPIPVRGATCFFVRFGDKIRDCIEAPGQVLPALHGVLKH